MKHLSPTSIKFLLHIQSKKSEQKGFSLVITAISIVFLGSLLLVSALVSKIDTLSTTASDNSNAGFYSAEAALNLGANDIREEFIGFQRPSGTEVNSWEDCIDAISSNDGSGDFACNTSLQINGQQIITYVEDITDDSAISVEIQDGVFRGLNAQEYRYDLVAVALDQIGSAGNNQAGNNQGVQLVQSGGQRTPSAVLGLRFKSRLVPLFQFAAFYNQDLDVFAPPTLTLNGRVHSNEDLYLNASTGNRLDITGIVSTGGTLFHGEKWTNSCSTTVRIANSNNNLSPLVGCTSSNRSRQSFTQSDVNANWADRIFIESDTLTLPEIDNYQVPPDNVIGNASRVEDEHVYWDRADIRLMLNLSGTGDTPSSITVVNSNGTTNSAATNTLNACTPISTRLTSDAQGDTINLSVISTAGFSIGDPIQVGSDFDSNVIADIPDDNTIVIKRRLGHSYQPGTIASSGEIVKKAVAWTSDTFYNYREKDGAIGIHEGKFIRMLNLDVGEFLNCIDANVGGNGIMGNKELDEESDGGMVWFLGVDGRDSHVDVGEGDNPNNYGIRVYNGATLASTNSSARDVKGLTVVSDQAVYIQGNYNSHGTKRPASFITDTLNILSTAWTLDDSTSYGYNTSSNLQTNPTYVRTVFPPEDFPSGNPPITRVAGNTTINAAFFAGIDVTGGDNGLDNADRGFDSLGGGLNNYPRMHEDWGVSSNCPNGSGFASRCTLTIRGSLVSFGAAQRVNGDYCGSHHATCNIYNPPFRVWSYDTDFDQAQNLPPLSPRAVYLTQELFERDFTYTSSKPQSLPLKASVNFTSKSNSTNRKHLAFLTNFTL